jgi:hypothetical protein
MGRKIRDISGMRFGRLVAIRPTGEKSGTSLVWLCSCDCGKSKNISVKLLVEGRRKSCGCKMITHAEAERLVERKKLRSVWAAMIKRCIHPKNKDYRYYGARGIKVCERWMVFNNFLEDIGTRPKGLTLDRVNNDGDYEPGNFRWATRTQQMNNTRLCKTNV